MPFIWGQNSNILLQIPESDSIESDIYNAQQQKDIVERNIFGMSDCKKMMPEASDNGSQPYRNAFRCFEMAGGKGYPIISACLYGRRQGWFLSLAYQQGCMCAMLLLPAISQSPGGQLYGWLPLSNAYGIFTVAIRPQTIMPTLFLPSKRNSNLIV